MSDNKAQHRIGCLNHEPHVPGEECNRMRVSGIYGLGVNPTGGACGTGFCDKAARESARIGSLTGVVKEPVYGVAQQARAPGKMFSRSDILAVLRGLAAELTAQGIHSAVLLALERARTIFEHLE